MSRDGKDTLVVMPPGYDKSEIRDVAASAAPGVTIVISPEPDELGSAGSACLFLAAEQLADEDVLARARDCEPLMIVVDEAECVAESSGAFRPDWLRVGAFIAEMGHPTVLAFTAVESDTVHQEIIEKLHLHAPRVVVR
jgi:ATP-dependent DNA helicase RecQ